MNQHTEPGRVKIERVTEDIRVVSQDGESRMELRVSCTTCGRESWSTQAEENQMDSAGWFYSRITRDHGVGFCPDHSPQGLAIAIDARERIEEIAQDAVRNGTSPDQTEPGRGCRHTSTPQGSTPAQPSSGSPPCPRASPAGTRQIKKAHFPHLARQQKGYMTSRIMERAWNCSARDLSWPEVESIWLELSMYLRPGHSAPRAVQSTRT